MNYWGKITKKRIGNVMGNKKSTPIRGCLQKYATKKLPVDCKGSKISGSWALILEKFWREPQSGCLFRMLLRGGGGFFSVCMLHYKYNLFTFGVS